MKIGILGGGASGLAAAISAAKNGADVTILEKTERVGKKILATGNGRCNYTNTNISIENYFSSEIKLLEQIFNQDTYSRIISFFNNLGIHPLELEDGKIYPNSLQASNVLDVLRYECKRLGVEEICNSEVISLRKNGDFTVELKSREKYKFDKVICALGGKAGAQYGSMGDGYGILGKIGHTVIPVFPGLVQLKVKSEFLKKIKGVKIQGKISLISEKKQIDVQSGEILFTDYGISGPPVLQISRKAVELLKEETETVVSVDLFPGYSDLDLYQVIENRNNSMKYKTIEESFIGLINKRLIPAILEEAGIADSKMRCTVLNKKQLFNIVNVLKNWKFIVTGHNDWYQAQVTAGGIKLSEINLDTMESKIMSDLYITGEILDVDGKCGGYNLHWAWLSGIIAGENAVS